MSIALNNRVNRLEDRLDAMAPQFEEMERVLAELQDSVAALLRDRANTKNPTHGRTNGASRGAPAG